MEHNDTQDTVFAFTELTVKWNREVKKFFKANVKQRRHSGEESVKTLLELMEEQLCQTQCQGRPSVSW